VTVGLESHGTPRPEVAVGAIAVDAERLLLVRRGHGPAAGLWSVPGGRVEPGEMLVEAVVRELAEETGFTPADLVAEEGWFSVLDGARLAQVKILRARETSAALRARMRAHIAGQREPELAEVRVVRSAADFDPMMPSFVTAFLTHVWSTEAPD